MKVERKSIEFGEYCFDGYRLEDGSYWLSVNQVKAKINKFDNMLEHLAHFLNQPILDIEIDGEVVQVVSFPVAAMYWTHYCINEKDKFAKKLLSNIKQAGMAL